jgi:hypothetical protein
VISTEDKVDESTQVNRGQEAESSSQHRKVVAMVIIPIFDGTANSDPEKNFKQFKRACMANGGRDPVAWLELLPIHLDDEAS